MVSRNAPILDSPIISTKIISNAKIVRSTIVLLRFPGVVAVPWPLLHRVSLGE
jgi:hypothetical protein